MKNCAECGASNATRARFCSKCGSPFRVSDAEPSDSNAPATPSWTTLDSDSVSTSVKRARRTKRAVPDEQDDENVRTGRSVRTGVPARSNASRARTPRRPIDLNKPTRETDGTGKTTSGATFWSAVGAFLRSAGTILIGIFRFLRSRVWPALVYLFRNAPAIFSALGALAGRCWRASQPLRTKAAENAPRLAAAVWARCRTALAPSATWPAEYVPNFLIWGVVELFVFRLPFALIGVFYAILANESREEADFARARNRAARAKGWLIADLAVGIAVAFLKTLGVLGSWTLGAFF